MVQRGGTVKMNVQNVTLLVCVATLVMVACVLFKTCVNEGFRGHAPNTSSNGPGSGGDGNNGGGNPNNASAGSGSSNSLVTNNQSPNGGGGGVCGACKSNPDIKCPEFCN